MRCRSSRSRMHQVHVDQRTDAERSPARSSPATTNSLGGGVVRALPPPWVSGSPPGRWSGRTLHHADRPGVVSAIRCPDFRLDVWQPARSVGVVVWRRLAATDSRSATIADERCRIRRRTHPKTSSSAHAPFWLAMNRDQRATPAKVAHVGRGSNPEQTLGITAQRACPRMPPPRRRRGCGRRFEVDVDEVPQIVVFQTADTAPRQTLRSIQSARVCLRRTGRIHLASHIGRTR
ncbi:hypothetical protein BJ973_005643 [Actinoplanes tereljensis]